MRILKPLQSTTRRLLAGTALAAFCVAPLLGWAQVFPDKPIRIISGLPPGASVDALGRLVGQALSERLGQPVLMDNRPGANMMIAAEAVARSKPDGYTLFLTMDLPFVANPDLYAKIPYDPRKDFAFITLLATSPMVIAANASSNVKTFNEYAQKAKATPSKVPSFGTGVIAAQLAGELVKKESGLQLTHIPYRGGGPAVLALVGDTVDLSITDITPILPFVEAGKLVALGVTSDKRYPLLPHVPTLIEQGYGNVNLINWIGLVAPAGTPEEILNKLNSEIVAIMAQPAMRERVQKLGVQPLTSTRAEMAARVEEDRAKWGALIKATGIRLD